MEERETLKNLLKVLDNRWGRRPPFIVLPKNNRWRLFRELAGSTGPTSGLVLAAIKMLLDILVSKQQGAPDVAAELGR